MENTLAKNSLQVICLGLRFPFERVLQAKESLAFAGHGMMARILVSLLTRT